jgi:thiamine pyrophosphokinase
MLVGGAEVNHDLLREAMQLTSAMVAADGGAALALEIGVMPEAVIGDLDSLPDAVAAQIAPKRVHRIEEQDSTDFDKCLRHIEAPLTIGVGFSGGRVDHQLAAFATLVRHAGRRCILVGEEDLVFLAPPSLRMRPVIGSRMSLFAMAAVEGVSEGLRWPIKGLNFAPDGRDGTSNEVVGEVFLAVTAPKMLVILPVSELAEVVRALSGAVARWPSP